LQIIADEEHLKMIEKLLTAIADVNAAAADNYKN